MLVLQVRWSDEDASDDEGLWNDVRGFWSDDEEEDFGGHWRKGRQARGGKREPRVRGMTYSKPRHDIVTHYNATTQVRSPLRTCCHPCQALRQHLLAWPLNHLLHTL